MLQTPEEEYKARKQWFIDRIGKRVFRNATTCTCGVCKNVENEGLVIFDKMHADYLCDVEGCSAEEPIHLIRYFDTMDEAKAFEKSKQENAN